MLEAKDISKRFWSEAASTPVYILNRCPTKNMVERTPYKAGTSVKLNVTHLRVFGSM